MATNALFKQARQLCDVGDYHELRVLLAKEPRLVNAMDDSGATLLICLIDYPGNRPNAARSARVLLNAGAKPDFRRNRSNGTALAGALSTNDWDVARVLLEFGADFRAPLGFKRGSVIDLADELCASAAERDDLGNQQLVKLVYDYTGIKLPRPKSISKKK